MGQFKEGDIIKAEVKEGDIVFSKGKKKDLAKKEEETPPEPEPAPV